MNVISGQYAWYGLFAVALFIARTTQLLFDDPEGPNLLIVAALGLVLFGASLLVYRPRVNLSRFWRFVVAVLVQLTVGAVLYFVFR
jgi:hypothetical protein